MAATVEADFTFEPKVWQDHVMAYFDRLLVYGAFAFRDNTLTQEPGLTVNFPFFNQIGDAQEPGESEGLEVDNLSDDSFYATVKEVAKAVGIKKKAFKKSAASRERNISEAQMQIARVMAEKVDKDLIAEIATAGNFTAGFTATAASHVCNVANLMEAKVVAFGDKHSQAYVTFMHSRHFLDLARSGAVVEVTAAPVTTITAGGGFLQGDSNDQEILVTGRKGQLLGMTIVEVDTVGTVSTIDSASAYPAWIHKPNSYGIMMKQDMEVDSDYDLLHREWVFTGNEWYAVKSFHAKVSADDKRTAKAIFTIS
jgi:N4-gp56 family major capsid protein